MTSLRPALLSLLFVLELVALLGVLRWGYGDGGLDGAALGVAAMAAMAALWGLLAAPKAPRRLAGWALAAFMTAWFGVAALALAVAFAPVTGVVFAVLVAATKGLLAVSGGNPSAPPPVQGERPHVGE
ncbi:MAG TPA: DUF2568 domain-containing protein [Pedococcus sp.]